jgi:hypothetical protein
MTSQDPNTGGATNFIVFLNLLKEFGFMIWKKALPDPRIVELEYRHGNRDTGGFFIMQECFISSCPVSVILSICLESRSEAQNQYELSFPTIGTKLKAYFNPSIILSFLPGVVY